MSKCNCIGGKCIEHEGKTVCICPPEHVSYKFLFDRTCRACNCGQDSNCTIVRHGLKEVKTCICKEGYTENKKMCTECDCGEKGTCSFDANDAKQCACNTGYALYKNGKCEECDCGESGTCSFDRNDAKQCVCNTGYALHKTGKCQECDCGEKGTCSFDRNDAKQCVCNIGTVLHKNGKCQECDCGNKGTCSFEVNDNKKCDCEKGYVVNKDKKCQEIHICDLYKPCENSATCYENGRDYLCLCEEGLTGKNCTESKWCVENRDITCGRVPCVYDSQRNMSFCSCSNYLLFNVNSKRCEPCYCGDHGNCLSEDGMKRCECEDNYSEKDGICYEIQSNTSTSISSTRPVTQPSCNCGTKSTGCDYDSLGRKQCFCLPGYAQIGDVCSGTCSKDSDCFNEGICSRGEDGRDYFCKCAPTYKGDWCELNEMCERLGPSCEAIGASCRVIGTTAACECPPEKIYQPLFGVCEDICDSRKCVHGRCEIVEKSYKCKCDEGFTGLHCDDTIENKPGRPCIWMSCLTLVNAVAMFSIMTLCFCCILMRSKRKLLEERSC